LFTAIGACELKRAHSKISLKAGDRGETAAPGCLISLVRSMANNGEQASRLRHSSPDRPGVHNT
jgi:hypothetical protein